MKTLIALTLLFSSLAQAKIVVQNGTFYVEGKGNRTPIALLNNLAGSGSITQVKLFADGKVNLVAFAKKNEKEKLYSVSEDGYLYSLKPFTNYQVKTVTASGRVKFKEYPGRSYKIDSKGFFLY